jgi:hypothetical protein
MNRRGFGLDTQAISFCYLRQLLHLDLRHLQLIGKRVVLSLQGLQARVTISQVLAKPIPFVRQPLQLIC